MAEIHAEIFREYDIRGITDTQLDSRTSRLIGRGLGTLLVRSGAREVVIGRDVRLSSDRIRDDLVEGLLSTGLHIIDVGVVPTPATYFALHTLECGGGIMITGSHNPAEYNGFKTSVGKESIHGEKIQEVRRLIEADDFVEAIGGVLEARDILPNYLGRLTEDIRPERGLTVVVDGGNGVGGSHVCNILETLGCTVHRLYCEPDGNFPNHHPDPTVEANLADLIAKIHETRADLGIALDGDADRIGAVDDQGGIIWGDRLLALFARDVLRDGPTSIIFEVKCSRGLIEDIEAHGGTPVMWKAGHSLIKEKMKETGALLAGEMSGHMFFKHRFYGFDDALYSAARLVEIVANENAPLSEIMATIPSYPSTPEIRIDCPEEHKAPVVEEILQHFATDHEVIDVDGARIDFGDGWGLVRASNTTPLLVLRFEASTEDRLAEIRSEVESKLAEILRARAVAS
ncbi:MAG: phosphomannomutase/phosphoglucomutase [Gemmatimonadota bacterium]|jgi:phosphomannomutase/phosphoglucomutase|nr:phosphomannomutase/phosphoglucomutase [Gemmatimonadota bacterium]MDP6529348.1 phosphomannomutase/phosphoglucomutase [Gemmatimonadota bacterium]MDP6802163.1 phosphomannomutase/phosphoglucomutase [Gemmatimonadota bacterium]MDP7031493.1 phosphomannomutase/phosphoglucomutase [Gemmatimonadota bacterium]